MCSDPMQVLLYWFVVSAKNNIYAIWLTMQNSLQNQNKPVVIESNKKAINQICWQTKTLGISKSNTISKTVPKTTLPRHAKRNNYHQTMHHVLAKIRLKHASVSYVREISHRNCATVTPLEILKYFESELDAFLMILSIFLFEFFPTFPAMLKKSWTTKIQKYFHQDQIFLQYVTEFACKI